MNNSILRIKVQLIISALFVFSCGEAGKQKVVKKVSDTVTTVQKVDAVQTSLKNLPKKEIQNSPKNRVEGKTYVGQLSQSCALTSNGAYYVYMLLQLKFDHDHVTVTNLRVASSLRIINEKNYTYQINGNQILIDGLEDFKSFKIKNDKLIGTNRSDSTIDFLTGKGSFFDR